MKASAGNTSSGVNQPGLIQSSEHHLSLVNAIVETALQAPDLSSMLQALADHLGTLIQADDCYITLWDQDQRLPTPAAASGEMRAPYLNLKIEPEQASITAVVLQSGAPIVLERVQHSTFANAQIVQAFPIASLLGIPLLAGERKLGAVIFAFKAEHTFPPEEIERCEQVCRLCALAIAKAQFIEEAGRRSEELETLFKISRAMRSARTRAEIPPVALDQILHVFDVQGAALEIFEPGGSETVIEQARGAWLGWSGKHIPIAHSASNELAATRQPCLNPHALAENHHAPRYGWPALNAPVQCTAGAPLVSQERVMGALWIGSEHPITPTQLRLLAAVGDMVAAALHRQALHENLLAQFEAVRAAQARLVQSEKLAAIGELIAGVAHELNTPLTSILLAAQLIQQQDGGAEIQEDVSRMITDARRAAKTVRHLLDFARQRPVERKLTQVNEVILSTLDLVSYELRSNDIRWETHLDPLLPPTLADPHQLQQVFVNLINNARQAIRSSERSTAAGGQISITTETRSGFLRKHTSPPSSVIRISFTDNGPGIPPGLQESIFDPFFTTKQEGLGTGLGLSICQGIISEHDGLIWAESQPGQGAVFLIELPVITSLPATKEDLAPSQPAELAPALSSSTGRILLIDDEANMITVLARVLRRRGHQVDTAYNGIQALACLAQTDYDLILSDIRMPELSGPDFYRQVRAQNPSAAERIVFTTGDTLNAATRRFLEETGAAYLTKPFEIDELVERVNQAMKERL